jgi:hypothetical protein
MKTNLEEQKSKKIFNFIRWWVAIWYVLYPIIFFGSWSIYSHIFAISMPKANGEPFDDLGMFAGIIPSFFTICLTKFLHDKILVKILNRLSEDKFCHCIEPLVAPNQFPKQCHKCKLTVNF